jgi:Uma2 family endonuclease
MTMIAAPVKIPIKNLQLAPGSMVTEVTEAVRDCMRMDLSVYPPPDLEIEAYITSKTTLDAYELLQVPEVWVYDSGKLMICRLENGQYQASPVSQVFPDLPIPTLIPALIAPTLQVGSRQMLRELRRHMTTDGLVK